MHTHAHSMDSTTSQNHRLELLREREVLRLVPQIFATDPVVVSDSLKTTSQTPALVCCADATQPVIRTVLPASAHDPVLTGLAQLAALRLNVRRCLVSVFDRRRQLVISEATRSSSIVASTQPQDDIWLGGTAIPRSQGICEHLLFAPPSSDPASVQVPISVVPDLSLDPRFCNRFYISQPPFNRFYAGIPLVSHSGVRYGVLCVFDDRPRPSLSDEHMLVLRELCHTITAHLESSQPATTSSRGERMIRGLRNFFEGKTTLSRQHSGSSVGSYHSSRLEDDPKQCHGLADDPAAAGSRRSSDGDKRPSPTPLQAISGINTTSSDKPLVADSSGFNLPSTSTASTRTIRTLSSPQDSVSVESRAIFGRAANIIRASVEVDGVMFLDARISSFGGLVLGEDGNPQNSEDDNAVPSPDGPQVHRIPPKSCRLFGYSTPAHSGIGHDSSPFYPSISENALQALLNRYPTGTVFNFDEDGRSTDNIDDDHAAGNLTSDTVGDGLCRRASTPHVSRAEVSENSPDSSASRLHDAKVVGSMLPGARSILLVPLWDPRREKWYAGGLMWTNNPGRCFSFGAEMSYLRAFATTIMSNVDRLDAVASERAKTDLLGSLSHELRSPLHGIVAAIEMLQDTELDAFQRGLLHTMDSCGHTLVDVIDHLLDYSKLTTRPKSKKDTPTPPTGQADSDKLKAFTPPTVTTGAIDLDALVEETMESVFSSVQFSRASDTFKHLPKGAEAPRRQSLSRSDSVWSSGSTLTWASDPPPETVDPSAVSVFLECDAQASWSYRIEAGALRRLIMNLLGNALKFTESGFIKVSVRQEQRQRSNQAWSNHLLLNITDSGRGMEPDFLRYQAFRPFSQEDPLTQGTGLGLSVVKKIVQALHGSLHIESEVSRGTSIMVAIPLGDPVVPALPLSSFQEHVVALKNLRVGLYGFAREAASSPSAHTGTALLELEMMTTICRDWLKLEIVPSDARDIIPDIILCADAVSGELMANADARLPPVVAVCGSAVTAHTYSLKYQEGDQARVFQAISQPIGPRKLANALVLALGRYNDAKVSELVWPPPQPPRPRTQGVSFLDSLLTPDFVSGSEFPFMADSVHHTVPQQVSSQQHNDSQMQNTSLPVAESPTTPNEPPAPEQDLTDSIVFKLNDLSLPAEKLAAAQSDLTNDAPESHDWTPMSSGHAIPAQRVPRNQFLLVDDNNINLRILVSFMKKLGRPYQTATNGLEALEAYSVIPCPFSHVLMDISMPVMDGLESTRLIRQFERMQQLVPAKVVALTGLASATAQNEAFASGVDVYLTKPARFKELAPLLST